MEPFEPTIVRMTQMLKDTFLAVQKNCDKCQVEEWQPWGGWTACTTTCGVGSQMRTRTCNTDRRSNCEGAATENRQCFSQPCCGDSQWSQWCAWTACSGQCGGVKTRTRSCIAQRGCPADDCEGKSIDELQCGLAVVDGNWGSWAPWVMGTGTCGTVQKTRSRLCNRPAPNECGAPCRGPDDDVTVEDLGPCTCRSTRFSMWSQWSGCTASCGNGLQTRTRGCEEYEVPLRGNRRCPPEECQAPRFGFSTDPLFEDTKTCVSQPCCGDWQWSSWSVGQCSATCGVAVRSKTRECQNVRAGQYCPAEPFQCNKNQSPMTTDENCPFVQCPQPCIEREWSAWGQWSRCPVTCDGGDQSRTRRCEIVAGTRECPGARRSQCRGEDLDERRCNDNPCPTCRQTSWSTWVRWTRCSQTCGGGTQERTRTCRVTAPGAPCPSRGDTPLQCAPSHAPDRQMRSCNDQACPTCRESQWTSWGRWSSCNCNTLKKTRDRQCEIVVDGVECATSLTMCNPYRNRVQTDDQDCRDPSCCEQKSWASWTPWSACPVSCKDQFSSRQPVMQTRQRQCRVTKRGNDCGYADCDGVGRDSRECNLPTCEPCKVTSWSSWARWDRCDCATKTQSRTRTCEVITDGRDGLECRTSMPCDPRYDRPQTDDRTCDDPSCCVPIDAEWSIWSSWSQCENRCGSEEVTRQRVCDRTRMNSCGRDTCQGRSVDKKTQQCGPREQFGRFGSWEAWSQCSATCGTGDRSRTRECSLTPAQLRQDCTRPCAGNAIEVAKCDAGPCCEVRAWTTWETWSACDTTCDRGVRHRSRLCRVVVPGNKCRNTVDQFGRPYEFECPGLPEQTEDCNNRPCDIILPPKYGPWEAWCPCDCKTGKESRRRSCYRVDPLTRQISTELKVDLALCQDFGASREERDCDVSKASCPACKQSCTDERGNPLRDGDYPSCSSCANYISCTSGRAIEYRCNRDGSNTEWDSYVRKCVAAPSASCSLHAPVRDCRNKPNRGRYHSSRGCEFYVECNNGQLLDRECRNGKEFDAHTGKCRTGRSWTCMRQFISVNRAVIGGRVNNIRPNDAPADMFYAGSLNSTERRLAYEKKMKEKHDDALTAAKNAERVRLGLDPAPNTSTQAEPEQKFLRRVNPECVTSCDDRPAGHYGSCRACDSYVICTRHGHLRERRCHGGKEFDVAKKKCVHKSQTCVLKGVLTEGE